MLEAMVDRGLEIGGLSRVLELALGYRLLLESHQPGDCGLRASWACPAPCVQDLPPLDKGSDPHPIATQLQASGQVMAGTLSEQLCS